MNVTISSNLDNLVCDVVPGLGADAMPVLEVPGVGEVIGEPNEFFGQFVWLVAHESESEA